MDQQPQRREPAADGLSRAADVSGKLLVISAAVVLACLFLWSLRAVAIPIFLAVLVATQLLPVVEWLKSKRWPTGLAVVVSLLASVLVFSAVMVGVIGQFVGELDDLTTQVSSGADDAAKWLAANSGPLNWTESDVNREVEKLGDRLQEGRDTIFKGVVGGASAVAGVGAGLLLAFAFLIYMLSDGGRAFRWFRDRFRDPDRREKVDRLGRRAWLTLGGYVRGVFLVATFDAVLIGAALFLFGVPLAAALTALVFLLAFIPIIGAWVSGIVATLVALAGVGVEAAVAIALVSLAVQQAESVVIGPMVYRRTVRLHPMVTLSVVTAGGILAGVIGAFIAVPITATVWAVFDEVHRQEAEQLLEVGDAAREAGPASTA